MLHFFKKTVNLSKIKEDPNHLARALGVRRAHWSEEQNQTCVILSRPASFHGWSVLLILNHSLIPFPTFLSFLTAEFSLPFSWLLSFCSPWLKLTFEVTTARLYSTLCIWVYLQLIYIYIFFFFSVTITHLLILHWAECFQHSYF